MEIGDAACLLDRLDVLHLENTRRINFIRNMTDAAGSGRNSVIKFFMSEYINKAEHVSLTCKYGFQTFWSFNKIKAMSFISFKNVAIV